MTVAARVSAIAASFLAALLSSPVLANSVDYGDYVAHVALTYGDTAYPCASQSDPTCAFVSILGVGDTSAIQPFSVPGASGFKNAIQSAHVDIFFNAGGSLSLDLLPGQIYVSVDQTNGGAGFGSAFGPTYPAATYGGGGDYAHYDLASDFYVQGFAPFCTDLLLCANGAALHTTSGKDLVITYPFAPVFSIFSSVVVPSVPEPGSAALFSFALGLLAVGRFRRS